VTMRPIARSSCCSIAIAREFSTRDKPRQRA
jgi:hypothetical protein